jgi:hypothetical protein
VARTSRHHGSAEHCSAQELLQGCCRGFLECDGQPPRLLVVAQALRGLLAVVLRRPRGPVHGLVGVADVGEVGRRGGRKPAWQNVTYVKARSHNGHC